NPKQTALAWLFHHTQQAVDLDHDTPEADLSSNADIRQIISDGKGTIEMVDLPDGEAAGHLALPSEESPPLLNPELFSGRIAGDWRIASFSGLTREVHQVPHAGAARGGPDEILN